MKNLNVMGRGKHLSTRARKALSEGNMEEVFAILKENYSIEGTVVHGRKMGRLLGFPTANLQVSEKTPVFLSNGVYVVHITLNNTLYHGIANIGVRPTFEHQGLSIEVHIFNFSEDLYGKTIQVIFIDRIRDERKFPDLTALKQQITSDVIKAEKILAARNKTDSHPK